MKTKFYLSLFTTVSLVLKPQITIAQTYQPSNRIPIADNSLGTQISRTNNNFTITGGLDRGQNLFHSFTDFSVPTGSAATFDNSLGKQSIITRVTGGNFSDINGLVNTQGANFFLLNPNGIVFGTNAQLNVGQTFVGSTANGVDLVDGGGTTVKFRTNRSGDAQLLTINPNALFNISRLNMGGGNSQISNFGTLQTANPNQYIGLIGGNVTMDGGQIYALGGRVELGGLSAPGTVTLGVDGNNFRAQFPTNVTRGDVSLTNQAAIRVEGIGGGGIAITARNLEILGGSFVSGGIFPGFGTSESVAGDIKVNADRIVISGFNSSIINQVGLNSTGKGGNITIDAASSLSLQDGAQIGALTAGRGDAGDVIINARKATVSLVDARILSSVANNIDRLPGDGSGGDILIGAGSLSLRDGSQLQTSTIGRIEDLQTFSRNDRVGGVTVLVVGAFDVAGTKNSLPSGIITSTTPGTSSGGSINIQADSFSLRDGAQLTSSTLSTNDTSLSNQNAGDIAILVKKTFDITGTQDGFVSGIYSFVSPGIFGKAGNIRIGTGSLSLRDGARIIGTNQGQGRSGAIGISADDFVTITAGKDIPSGLSVLSSSPTGTAGDIIINSPKITLDGAQIDAISTSGKGGNINIGGKLPLQYTFDLSDKIPEANLLLLRRSSLISTDAGGTSQQGGDGGNININSKLIVAAPRENSDITANAVKGRGGNIQINSQSILGLQSRSQATPQTNDITASSEFGTSGKVTLNTPDLDPSRGLSALPTTTTDPTNQINPNCSAKAIANNSFTSVGRGGIPATPKDPLNEQEIATNWVRLNPQDAVPSTPIAITPAQLPHPIVEAQGWRRERNGDIILVAGSSVGTLPRSAQPQSGCVR